MAGVSNRLSAGVFVVLLLFSTTSSLLLPTSQSDEVSTFNPEWVRFEVREDAYHDAKGVMDDTLTPEHRALEARTPIGVFDHLGFTLDRPVPDDLLEPRFDVLMLIVSNEMHLQQVRNELDRQPGLAVREFVSPSGLMVQGTPHALQQAEQHPGIATGHAVPLAMFLHNDLLDLTLLDQGERALEQTLLRLDGWRNDDGPVETVSLADDTGGLLEQELGEVARQAMDDPRAWDSGRYEGTLVTTDMPALLRQPAVMQLRPDPAFSAFNDQSRGHMGTNTITTYFTTDLDGSGQTVACLLYTSPSPRDIGESRMPSSA